MSFHDSLKNLHRQAQQEAQARQEREREAARRRAEEVDFASEMAGVTPLKSSGRRVQTAPPKAIKPRRERPELEETDVFYVGSSLNADVPPVFSKNGQGSRDIERLQSGHWPVVADVDLHGYTQDEAQQVLSEFIAFVQVRGVCGEVIHGSGLGSRGYVPVLKTLVRTWLMRHPEVLAYAEPRPGNDGAVRILLKRRRKADPWAEE